MRKFITSTVFAGAASAAVIGLSSTPAFAATWTVSGGGGFTGSLASGTTAVITDVTAGITVTCPNGTAAGTAANGTGLSGTGIASVTSASFGTSSNKCSGPLGTTFIAALTSGSTWSLNAVSYNAGTGITTGTITGVDTTATGSSLFGSCNARVTGSAQNVTYNNNTHQITINEDNPASLTISNVSGSGCAGLIANGDQATLRATISLSPGTLVITSP